MIIAIILNIIVSGSIGFFKSAIEGTELGESYSLIKVNSKGSSILNTLMERNTSVHIDHVENYLRAKDKGDCDKIRNCPESTRQAMEMITDKRSTLSNLQTKSCLYEQICRNCVTILETRVKRLEEQHKQASKDLNEVSRFYGIIFLFFRKSQTLSSILIVSSSSQCYGRIRDVDI